MWLLILLTTLFAVFSQAMMSYLVMHWSLGPWVGPIFVVVCMTLLIPFISRKWFQEHALMTIAAGSIGGMVGLCLGMTVPSFYFLHKTEFLHLVAKPIWFAGIISLLVFGAGSVAFLIAYIIKDHFVKENQLPFPVAQLVYDIVSIEEYSSVHRLMWVGVAISCAWNMCVFLFRILLRSILMQVQAIPLLVCMGFIAGHIITIPAIIGLVNRFFALDILHKYFFEHVPGKEFLIMFCLGMLTIQIMYAVYLFFSWVQRRNDDQAMIVQVRKRLLDRRVLVIGVGMVSGTILSFFNISLYEMLFLFPILILIGINVARIVGEIGIIDIDGFVWCVLLPLLYASTISSMNLLVIALFATVCLGMIIDLMFSYKLTQLAGISYQRVVKYQILSFFVATVTAGFVMWFYAQSFDEQSLHLFARDAQDFDALILFGSFNYKIFVCGMMVALLVLLSQQPLLVVIGLTLMAPTISVWLIVAGLVSYLVQDRQKLYPLWFGIYATHALWMIVWSFV